MTKTKNRLRVSGRTPLLILAVLVTLSLAGRAMMESGEQGPIRRKAVSFTGRLNQSAVLLGGDGAVQMELVIAAEKRRAEARVPTDLVVILDRSGSMAGKKIDCARAAVGELISQLDGEDRFALVSYSSDARLSLSLTPATASAKAAWRSIVNDIETGGGTNMSRGIDVAINVLPASRESRRAARIILISDGLANEGDTTVEGLEARASGISVREYVLSTVGVGDDFNEFLMSALADAGTGNYYYLENSTELARVFASEFEATRQTVATGVAVTIAPGAGVEVIDAAGYPLERDGDHVSFRPGTLFSGQERRIWLMLRVPNSRAGRYELGAFTLSYSDGNERHLLELDDVPRVACVADESRFFASVDPSGWEESVIHEAYNRLQEKVALAVKEGRREDAVREIGSYRARQSWMNQRMESDAVAGNLAEVEELESQVRDAFSGANQADKQNILSKTRQAAGRDGRRAGSKK